MEKKVCLIDYENTALPGLDGLENLSTGDCIRIICSNENIGNTLLHILSIYRERNITVEVEYMSQRGSNALDFRISCDLGYFIAQGDVSQIYVISKDRGYLHAISEASALNSDVLIVCGASIRDCLFKVEHGMTELPIEDYIKPCKEAREADAAMRLEWQKANAGAEDNKTAKALNMIKKKMPVMGRKKTGIQKKQSDKNTDHQEKEQKAKAESQEKQPKAKAESREKTPKEKAPKAKAESREKKLNKKTGDQQEQPDKKNTAKHMGNNKPKDLKTKTQDDLEAMSSAQKKKLQQEIKAYIDKHTSIEENYTIHLAALIIRENSIMDFRRAAKTVLGKKHEAYEAEAVAAYMHYRR